MSAPHQSLEDLLLTPLSPLEDELTKAVPNIEPPVEEIKKGKIDLKNYRENLVRGMNEFLSQPPVTLSYLDNVRLNGGRTETVGSRGTNEGLDSSLFKEPRSYNMGKDVRNIHNDQQDYAQLYKTNNRCDNLSTAGRRKKAKMESNSEMQANNRFHPEDIIGGMEVAKHLMSSQSWDNSEIDHYEANLMLDAAQGFLIMVDKKMDIIFVSENVSEYLGFTQTQMIGHNVFTFFPEKEPSCLEAHVDVYTLINGVTGKASSECKRVSFFTEMKYRFPVKDKQNAASGTSLFEWTCQLELGHDATTGQVYIESLVSLCTLTHIEKIAYTPHLCNVNVITTKLDLALQVISADPGLELIMGYTKEEVRARGIYTVKHPCDIFTTIQVKMPELIKGKDCGYHRVITKQGNIIWLYGRAILVTDKWDKPSYIRIYSYLVSEKVAETAMRKDPEEYKRFKGLGFGRRYVELQQAKQAREKQIYLENTTKEITNSPRQAFCKSSPTQNALMPVSKNADITGSNKGWGNSLSSDYVPQRMQAMILPISTNFTSMPFTIPKPPVYPPVCYVKPHNSQSLGCFRSESTKNETERPAVPDRHSSSRRESQASSSTEPCVVVSETDSSSDSIIDVGSQSDLDLVPQINQKSFSFWSELFDGPTSEPESPQTARRGSGDTYVVPDITTNVSANSDLFPASNIFDNQNLQSNNNERNTDINSGMNDSGMPHKNSPTFHSAQGLSNDSTDNMPEISVDDLEQVFDEIKAFARDEGQKSKIQCHSTHANSFNPSGHKRDSALKSKHSMEKHKTYPPKDYLSQTIKKQKVKKEASRSKFVDRCRCCKRCQRIRTSKVLKELLEEEEIFGDILSSATQDLYTTDPYLPTPTIPLRLESLSSKGSEKQRFSSDQPTKQRIYSKNMNSHLPGTKLSEHSTILSHRTTENISREQTMPRPLSHPQVVNENKTVLEFQPYQKHQRMPAAEAPCDGNYNISSYSPPSSVTQMRHDNQRFNSLPHRNFQTNPDRNFFDYLY